MSGASQKITRGKLQDLVIKHVMDNPKDREAFINDPKSFIERRLNVSLGNVTVKALVETADTIYVVVPHVPSEGELSDEDLSQVAGGGDSHVRWPTNDPS